MGASALSIRLNNFVVVTFRKGNWHCISHEYITGNKHNSGNILSLMFIVLVWLVAVSALNCVKVDDGNEFLIYADLSFVGLTLNELGMRSAVHWLCLSWFLELGFRGWSHHFFRLKEDLSFGRKCCIEFFPGFIKANQMSREIYEYSRMRKKNSSSTFPLEVDFLFHYSLWFILTVLTIETIPGKEQTGFIISTRATFKSLRFVFLLNKKRKTHRKFTSQKRTEKNPFRNDIRFVDAFKKTKQANIINLADSTKDSGPMCIAIESDRHGRDVQCTDSSPPRTELMTAKSTIQISGNSSFEHFHINRIYSWISPTRWVARNSYYR